MIGMSTSRAGMDRTGKESFAVSEKGMGMAADDMEDGGIDFVGKQTPFQLVS